MANTSQSELGSVVSLWRYPVKSMMGEELNRADVTERGLLGDRAHALIDRSDGKVASAKNPRKWPHLFDFRAAFVAPPRPGADVPAVRITLPDGTIVTSDQGDLNQILSGVLHREVMLDASGRGHEEVVSSSRGVGSVSVAGPSSYHERRDRLARTCGYLAYLPLDGIAPRSCGQ